MVEILKDYIYNGEHIVIKKINIDDYKSWYCGYVELDNKLGSILSECLKECCFDNKLWKQISNKFRDKITCCEKANHIIFDGKYMGKYFIGFNTLNTWSENSFKYAIDTAEELADIISEIKIR